MAKCDYCNGEMLKVDTCPANRVIEFEDGTGLPGIPWDGGDDNTRCHDCISNIKREYADIARQAAKEIGFPVVVKQIARSVTGDVLPNDVSVWTYAVARDHGPFWKRYDELKAELNQEVSR